MFSYVKMIQNKIQNYYKDENVSYEAKNFYLVSTCAFPVAIAIGLIFVLTNSDLRLGYFCFSIAVYVFLSTVAASLTKQQLRFSVLFCLLMNFFFIPVMFFLSEGVYYGMIMFFILGIILTTILLGRHKGVYILVGLEFAFDMFLVIYTFFFKERVYTGRSNLSQETAIAVAFMLVAVTIIFLFLYQNYIYAEMGRKVEKDNDAITKADNTKGRFLANMTHEIRTPMNAIIGMTNLMLKEELSNSSRESTTVIKAESAKLLQIINNILEFSKLDSGRAELINNVYSFREMITDVISSTVQEYSRDEIKLHVFLSKGISDKLFGDEVRIKQVMKYLLFSTLTRTPGGTVNIDITSDYDDTSCQANLIFRITSTGEGLNSDEISAIYNAYSNYDSRQKTDYNRAGLEVSICKKILNMMGGDLKIESIEGIGNAFEFSFANYVVDTTPIVSFDKDIFARPLVYLNDKTLELSWKRVFEEIGISGSYVRSPQSFRRALEKQTFSSIYIPQSVYPELIEYISSFGCEDIVYVLTDLTHSIGDFGACRILRHPVYLFNLIESLDGSYDRENYSSTIDMDKYIYPYARVLVVDDSNVNLMVMDNLLKEYEIKATFCDSGAKAIDILENNEYDIIFVDQKMPEMDGIELTERIRKLQNSNATAPVICATADFGSGLRDMLLSKGFSDYLSKPVNGMYLERMLKQYLPEELRISSMKQKAKKQVQDKQVENIEKSTELDPLIFKPEVGISNLGDNVEAYLSVLESYYIEGIQKLSDVPKQLEDGDISLYTTNVHALKSSSATVGCMGISPLFKALEFAGKEGNVEFIRENSDKTFELLSEVLGKVKEYLYDNGVSFDEDEQDSNDGELVSLDMALLSELSDSVKTMNLRRSEEIISELSSNNYGSEINQIIKKIKNAYDNFEYMEIMSYVKELL